MSIIVVCPGCRKSFKVSDKFAGKSGPCPKCKRTLNVPAKSEEVKVHAPEEFEGGGRSTTGKLVIKPVAFTPTRLHPVAVALIVASVVAVLAITWGGGDVLRHSMMAATIGLLAVSPLLVLAGYAVLRDPDLDPYSGKELYLRAAICSVAYVALWGVFDLLIWKGVITGELWNWVLIVPPFMLAGGLFSLATLDLGFGDSLFHYGFYLLATVILSWVAPMEWIWNVRSR